MMQLIRLKPLEAGVYIAWEPDNISTPPEGWAYIPDDMPLPSTFPRLGSLEAEELTYTREVEVEREVIKTREIETFHEVIKTREVESFDEEGKPITITEEYTEFEPITVTEEYTETEMVMETHEYKMMTITHMTEGTLPEVVPDPEPATELSVWDELDAAYQEGVDSV